MDIECKLKRTGGTRTSIETAEYHFAPRDDGAHVADVTIEAHVDRFLAISEGYCLYRGSAAAPKAEVTKATKAVPAPVVEAAPEPEVVILLGSSTHPAGFEIHGKTYALGDVVVLAQTASGLDAKEWNELEEDSRADLIDEELDKLNGAGQNAQPDEAAVRADLVAQYQAKFGTKPHYKLSVEKLRAKLAE